MPQNSFESRIVCYSESKKGNLRVIYVIKSYFCLHIIRMAFPTNMKAQNSPSYYATNSSNHFLKGWFSGRTKRVTAGNTAKGGGGDWKLKRWDGGRGRTSSANPTEVSAPERVA